MWLPVRRFARLDPQRAQAYRVWCLTQMDSPKRQRRRVLALAGSRPPVGSEPGFAFGLRWVRRRVRGARGVHIVPASVKRADTATQASPPALDSGPACRCQHRPRAGRRRDMHGGQRPAMRVPRPSMTETVAMFQPSSTTTPGSVSIEERCEAVGPAEGSRRYGEHSEQIQSSSGSTSSGRGSSIGSARPESQSSSIIKIWSPWKITRLIRPASSNQRSIASRRRTRRATRLTRLRLPRSPGPVSSGGTSCARRIWA